MPTYPLTAAWLRIASAGQAVEIQNLSAAPILITTGTSLPAATDGLLLAALEARAFALTADLYARVLGSAPGIVEVFGGFTLGGGGSGAAVPFATALPVITGTATVGQTLSASQGSWTGAPTAYAYQWQRAGASIAGATAATYTVVAADLGATLAVSVTATNAAGSAAATSAATAVVAGATTGGGGTSAGGGASSTADFTDPNNAYLAALAA